MMPPDVLLKTYSEIVDELGNNWEKNLEKHQVIAGDALFVKYLANLQDVVTVKSCWPLLTKKFGGFRLGELTIITGDTGMGKTTMAVNFMKQVADEGHFTFCFSLEMGPEAVIKKLFRMFCGRKPTKDNMTELYDKFCQWLKAKSFTFYAGQDYIPYSDCRSLIAWAVLKQECEFILIDHFEMILEQQVDAAKISRMVAGIRALAHKLNCHIVAIVHPSKRSTTDSKERMTEANDVKGSTGFKQFADNLMAVHFDKETKETILKLHKIRDDDFGRFQGDAITYSLGEMTLTYREGVEK